MNDDIRYEPYVHPEPPLLERKWQDDERMHSALPANFGLNEESLKQARLKEEDQSYKDSLLTT